MYVSLFLYIYVLCICMLYESAMRHEGISKCTGSRNNAKSHGCVYIVVLERTAPVNIRFKSRETVLLVLLGRF